jgi:hypothetical protein
MFVTPYRPLTTFSSLRFVSSAKRFSFQPQEARSLTSFATKANVIDAAVFHFSPLWSDLSVLRMNLCGGRDGDTQRDSGKTEKKPHPYPSSQEIQNRMPENYPNKDKIRSPWDL